MQISGWRPSKRIAILFHSVFASMYLLLIARAALSLHEGAAESLAPGALMTPRHDFILLRHIAGIIYDPFWVILSYPTIGGQLVTTILFAIGGYALLHYGMFVKVPIERSNSMVNKILDFCRMIFFLAGTLLVLLIVIRMGVMIYQDIAYEHFQMLIGTPKTGIH